jgi:hypothetical protein
MLDVPTTKEATKDVIVEHCLPTIPRSFCSKKSYCTMKFNCFANLKAENWAAAHETTLERPSKEEHCDHILVVLLYHTNDGKCTKIARLV